MLYIKINPIDGETHFNTPYHETGVSGANQAPKGGLMAPGPKVYKVYKVPWGTHKLCICKFLRILGMLYIKIDSIDRETH